MKFKLCESMSKTLLFRGVGANLNPGEKYHAGLFFTDNPMDALNYGDRCQVYTLINGANIYKGESSIECCKDMEVMDYPFPIIKELNNRTNCNVCTLNDVLDFCILEGEDPNLGLAIFQAVAKEMLVGDGYDGAEWSSEDDITPHQWQIWDEDVLILKEELDEEDALEKYDNI